MTSKSFGNLTYPLEVAEASPLFKRTESIIDIELLKKRFLNGINITGYDDSDLQTSINYAMNEFELLSNLYIYPVKKKERLPFDRALYISYIHLKVNSGPVLTLDSLNIASADGVKIFTLPPEWVEMGFAHKKQFNVMPLLSLFGVYPMAATTNTNAGLIFLMAATNFTWLPAYWLIEYTVGLSNNDGQVPSIVNDIIGCIAAIDILSAKQAGIMENATSISQDGLSQSSSGAGNQQYANRISDLKERKERNLSKIKTIFHSKYFVSNL